MNEKLIIGIGILVIIVAGVCLLAVDRDIKSSVDEDGYARPDER